MQFAHRHVERRAVRRSTCRRRFPFQPASQSVERSGAPSPNLSVQRSHRHRLNGQVLLRSSSLMLSSIGPSDPLDRMALAVIAMDAHGRVFDENRVLGPAEVIPTTRRQTLMDTATRPTTLLLCLIRLHSHLNYVLPNRSLMGRSSALLNANRSVERGVSRTLARIASSRARHPILMSDALASNVPTEHIDIMSTLRALPSQRCANRTCSLCLRSVVTRARSAGDFHGA